MLDRIHLTYGWVRLRVFVTGGTGAIGRHVIPVLVQEGHTVTALARTPAKAAALTAQGATPVSVSLFDRSALTAAFADRDAVVNLATTIPSMTRFMSVKAQRDNDRVRTEGSAAVVDAALAAGVGRLVQESVSMLYRDQGACWIDEDAPIDRYPMARANIAAETSTQRFSESGGTGIVLRFGWFYGPGAAHSEQLFAQARRRIGLVLGPLTATSPRSMWPTRPRPSPWPCGCAGLAGLPCCSATASPR